MVLKSEKAFISVNLNQSSKNVFYEKNHQQHYNNHFNYDYKDM